VPEPHEIDPFSSRPRPKSVQVLLAPEDWAELSRQAQQEGLSRAGLIRRALRAAKIIRPLRAAEAAT